MLSDTFKRNKSQTDNVSERSVAAGHLQTMND